MKESLISIIIPAYNAEKTIVACIESVLLQSFESTEIIVVDDGSTDNTISLLQKYALKDLRVKIVQQQNQSVGVARTNGVRVSTGDYIAFLDADDFYMPDMLEKLYNKAVKEGSDIVVCNFNEVDEERRITFRSNMKQEDVNFLGLLSLNINPATWNKLFKRELFDNVQFQEKIFCEDLASTIEPFYYAARIDFVEDALYNYFLNPQGGSSTLSIKHIDDIFVALQTNKSFLKKHGLIGEYFEEFLQRYIVQLHNIQDKIALLDVESQEKYTEYLYKKIETEKIFSLIDLDTTKRKATILKQFKSNVQLFYLYHFLALNMGIEMQLSAYEFLPFLDMILEIYNKKILSVYIYGYGGAFSFIETLLNYLGISIVGIIESQPVQRELGYIHGTIEIFANRLNEDSVIFIASLSYAVQISRLVQRFSIEYGLPLKVLLPVKV